MEGPVSGLVYEWIIMPICTQSIQRLTIQLHLPSKSRSLCLSSRILRERKRRRRRACYVASISTAAAEAKPALPLGPPRSEGGGRPRPAAGLLSDFGSGGRAGGRGAFFPSPHSQFANSWLAGITHCISPRQAPELQFSDSFEFGARQEE